MKPQQNITIQDVGIEDSILAIEDIISVLVADTGDILTDLDTEDAIEDVTERESAVKKLIIISHSIKINN